MEPTYSRVGPQLDEEPLALEAQLADLGPVEGVDLGVALKSNTWYEGGELLFFPLGSTPHCVPFTASRFDLVDFL